MENGGDDGETRLDWAKSFVKQGQDQSIMDVKG